MKNSLIFTSVAEDMGPEQSDYSPPKLAAAGLGVVALGLILFGLIALYSTTSGTRGAALLVKQAIWVFGGIALAMLINIIGYRRVIRLAPLFLVGAAALLIAARFSPAVKGAHRWIRLPGGIGNIQPSEFAKLALVMFLASYIPPRQRAFSAGLKGMLVPIAVTGAVMGLVILGGDLGTTLLIGAIAWSVLFVAGGRLRWLLLPFPVVPILPFAIQKLSAERWSRVVSYLDPEKYQMSDGYQLWLSLLALGSGDWFGLGLTQSRMKGEYLPESHTDFILSIVGEELGFVAMACLVLAYILLTCLAAYVSSRAKEKEGMLLVFGLTVMLAFQAIINIGVISGAFPTKGMSAPFISYGGSNMIMGLVSIGLMLSVATYTGEGSESVEPPTINVQDGQRENE